MTTILGTLAAAAFWLLAFFIYYKIQKHVYKKRKY
jgi:hypothetical protein